MADTEVIFNLLKISVFLSIGLYLFSKLLQKVYNDKSTILLFHNISKITLIIGLLPYLPWIGSFYAQDSLDLELILVVKWATLNNVYVLYFMIRHEHSKTSTKVLYPFYTFAIVTICIGFCAFIPKFGEFKYLSSLSKTSDTIKTKRQVPFYVLSTSSFQNYNYFEYMFYPSALKGHKDELKFIANENNKVETHKDDHHGEKIAKNAAHHAILSAYKELKNPLKYKIKVNVDFIYHSDLSLQDKSIKFGDQLLKINDIEIVSKSQLQTYLCDLKQNQVILQVQRKKSTLSIDHKLNDEYICEYQLGFELVEEFDYQKPKDIKIKHDKSIGDSSGLALALHVYYAKLGVAIDNNLKISITGAINENGIVRNVGGLHYKIMSALKEKSDYILLPKTMQKAYTKVLSKIDKEKYSHPSKIMFVSSLRDAIELLNPLIIVDKKRY